MFDFLNLLSGLDLVLVRAQIPEIGTIKTYYGENL